VCGVLGVVVLVCVSASAMRRGGTSADREAKVDSDAGGEESGSISG
jgi:hypothetical protein